MAAPLDCLKQEQRHSRRTLTLAAGLAALTAAWACWPLSQPPAPATASPPPSQTGAIPPASINFAAFDARLDHPRPAPAVATPAMPPPPLRLTLLAITSPSPATAVSKAAPDFEAMVYDAAQDAVVTVRVGDAIGGRRIQRIWPGGLEIADAHGARRLLLDDSPRPAQGEGSP